MVYASTIWVYSDTEHGVLEESMPLRPPAHLYSATKLAGELHCHSYHELYGLDYTILRFGPRAVRPARAPTSTPPRAPGTSLRACAAIRRASMCPTASLTPSTSSRRPRAASSGTSPSARSRST
jgi:hypothetical protein